jgi:hypothetical protein
MSFAHDDIEQHSFWQENPELVPRLKSVLDEVERRWRFYQGAPDYLDVVFAGD